ncbi:MAG: efflux RND transporter periplasmic adaptor subunit [Planctomycetes bacterium]|nr:efflux RND transporter periplasmic adaptor subunit [Planctomycetota bacterium]
MKKYEMYSKIKIALRDIQPVISKHRAIIIKLVLPLAVIMLGILIAAIMMATKPKSKRQPMSRQSRLVEVISAKPQDVTITIDAMGTVIAAVAVDLKPQVSGKIVEVSPDFVPGGIFKKGRTLMKIEPDDYQLVVQQAKAEVATAKSNLKLEQGNQQVAQREYELLEGIVSGSDKELMLRKPQLISAESSLDIANAKLGQAELDLGRTYIKSPFDAVIKDKAVDIGDTVSASNTLVTLAGTDEYWIEVMLPVDELKWIQMPGTNGNDGSKVKIYNSSGWGDGEYRIGRVIRLRPQLETNGRMAQLLVVVEDPLLLDDENSENKLLLGSYVRVEINGQKLKSVFSLDRSLLHDGDNIRLFSNDKTLIIKPVKVLYKGKNNVIIADGIKEEDKIITTDLAAPVVGMGLRLNLDAAESKP